MALWSQRRAKSSIGKRRLLQKSLRQRTLQNTLSPVYGFLSDKRLTSLQRGLQWLADGTAFDVLKDVLEKQTFARWRDGGVDMPKLASVACCGMAVLTCQNWLPLHVAML